MPPASVTTVGDPVVVSEYFASGTLKITTPLPPAPESETAPPAPPPVCCFCFGVDFFVIYCV